MMTVRTGNFTILTSYLINNCSSDEIKDLNQAVHDPNVIAFAGISSVDIINQPPIFFIDFSHEAAIDYFGPSPKNRDQQSRIYSNSCPDAISSDLCWPSADTNQPPCVEPLMPIEVWD